MAERVRGFAAVMAATLLAAACAPAKPPAPPPKPVPEPPQATPSAQALGPVRIIEPICARPPANGDILMGAVSPQGRHFYEITNQTDANAVVKIRTGDDGPLAVAVYVAPHDRVRIGPLIDGAYRMTYAMGGDLAPDCRRLDDPSGFGQFHRTDVLETTNEDGLSQGQTATYTLEESDVDGGDGPQALTAEKYYAP
ncbi:hypothetical protein QO010_001918 [Caulobacter ginsengisoli]|uniref:Uncharacterized protein n=1 Tax=Caulobacter ginsengisoli TaxID=400775 RepID=A0ABU0IT52_9CAUL|nr:hypothetical protein [Caulobacter ginsengisoli]MDQ0464147.1 hypothetical protein [Caulobacter ginsengisoli]